MTKLKDLYQIYLEIERSKTFGNLYKTDKYSLDIIQLFLTIPISTFEDELNKKSERTITELSSKPYYSTLVEIIDRLRISEEVDTSKEFIPIKNSLLQLINLDLIELGSLLEIYDSNYTYIGKAILVKIDYGQKTGKLNYFLTDSSKIPKFAYFEKWWDIVPQEVIWVRPDLLIPNSIASATLDVQFKISKHKLGRVQWEFFYTKNDKEILLAKGVDIVKSGLITITKPQALFNIGDYRLLIKDRRGLYNAPVKSELNWKILEPTSKISYVK